MCRVWSDTGTNFSALQTNRRYRTDFCEKARDQTGRRRQTIIIRMPNHSRSYPKGDMVSQWESRKGFTKTQGTQCYDYFSTFIGYQNFQKKELRSKNNL